ncbi:MAG: lysylphosphatidylglycerol synthase transmembrane domain-containing protein [Thermomicrobiales bacterium]
MDDAPISILEARPSDPDEVGAVRTPTGEPGNGSPPRLASRVLQPQTLISFGVAFAIAFFIFRRLDINAAEVWSNARHANLFLYGLAFVVFYAGFILRAARWRAMLARAGISSRHGYAVPGTRGLIEIYLLSWFANCIVPAKLGDAYRSYLLKRSSRAPFSLGVGTILAERLIDLMVLVVAMLGAAVVVFGRHQPTQATPAFVAGAALIVIGTVGLVAMWTLRNRLEHWIPSRVRDQYLRLHDGLFACLRKPTGYALISLVIWLSEGLRLYLVSLALGAEITPSTALFVALLSSLLTAIPLTPAGLGIVESAMVVMFRLVDVNVSMAASVALMDRVVGYWSLIAVGIVLYIRKMRREII